MSRLVAFPDERQELDLAFYNNDNDNNNDNNENNNNNSNNNSNKNNNT